MTIAFKASIVCLAAMAACSGARSQQGGHIAFKGAIGDHACTMVVPDSGQALPMGSIEPAQFGRVGEAHGQQRFTLAMAGCATPGNGSPRRASVRLLALNTHQRGDHLNLADAGQADAASGVQLRILGADGTPALPAPGAAHPAPASVNLNDGASRLAYSVDYITTALPVTAGRAVAAVNVEITYP